MACYRGQRLGRETKSKSTLKTAMHSLQSSRLQLAFFPQRHQKGNLSRQNNQPGISSLLCCVSVLIIDEQVNLRPQRPPSLAPAAPLLSHYLCGYAVPPRNVVPGYLTTLLPLPFLRSSGRTSCQISRPRQPLPPAKSKPVQSAQSRSFCVLNAAFASPRHKCIPVPCR